MRDKTDVKEELQKIRDMYYSGTGATSYNAIVYGDIGTGKTNLFRTCRMPVFIHSFDPGGTKTLKDEIDKGRIIVDNRFEVDDAKKPTAFRLWEKELDRLRGSDFFTKIGTFGIDSATTWGDAIMSAILKAQGRAGGVPQLQDYLVQMNTMRDYMKIFTSLPCDCILTAHVDIDKDEFTGRIVAGPMVTGKMKDKLPLLFDEMYVSVAKESSKGIEYSLLTRHTGFYKARTRLGREGRFDTYEEQNIKGLLKKAGMSTDDLETFDFKEEKDEDDRSS